MAAPPVIQSFQRSTGYLTYVNNGTNSRH